MRAGVLVFPGSNCDRDMAVALRQAGADVVMVWHKDTELPSELDLIAIPGGFSFGDYLRCGAIAAKSPICRSVVSLAEGGGFVKGVCNGFQVLTETGLLPGALMQNAGLKFLCKTVDLQVSMNESAFTQNYSQDQVISVPIAHHEGNYNLSPEDLKILRGENRIAFKYCDNPNGAMGDIAGVLSQNRRVLGMMPHPERAVDTLLGHSDGQPFFAGLIDQLAAA
jgi:phosphoribosylformylglycinamidine synthase I